MSVRLEVGILAGAKIASEFSVMLPKAESEQCQDCGPNPAPNTFEVVSAPLSPRQGQSSESECAGFNRLQWEDRTRTH